MTFIIKRMRNFRGINECIIFFKIFSSQKMRYLLDLSNCVEKSHIPNFKILVGLCLWDQEWQPPYVQICVLSWHTSVTHIGFPSGHIWFSLPIVSSLSPFFSSTNPRLGSVSTSRYVVQHFCPEFGIIYSNISHNDQINFIYLLSD